MTNPMLLSRVYLLITGFTKHSDVTDQLGVQPSSYWNAGDEYKISNKVAHRKHGSWTIGRDSLSDVPEDDQLHLLIERLGPFASALSQTPKEWKKKLVIVHQTESPNADILLPLESVAFAARIGAAFWLDIYSLPEEIDCKDGIQ